MHPPSHLLRKVQVVSSIQLSRKCEILQKKSVSKNVIHNTLVGSPMWLLKIVFKGDQSFTLVFTVYFCWFYGEKSLYKVFGRLGHIPRSYKVTMFGIQRKWRHFREMDKAFVSWFYLLFSSSFNLYRDVSDVIHTNERTK